MTRRELDLMADLVWTTWKPRPVYYCMPNTDENWAIVEAALAWYDMRADQPFGNHPPRPVLGDITANDCLVHAYLTDKATRELREATK